MREQQGLARMIWVATWGVDESVVRGLEARLREIIVRAVPPEALKPA